MIYFNDNEPYVAKWLTSLYSEAIVNSGSVCDIQAGDLARYRRVHLFAGIGGWEYALRLAGWPDGREVWTGSCPCQPFSNSGKRKGIDDERHLWPKFLRLISERRPTTIFGEQVASPLGREWLSGVRADLEALGYAVGAADLCAASIGAPHVRQRIFWVADSESLAGTIRCGETTKSASETKEVAQERKWVRSNSWSICSSVVCFDGNARRIPVEPEFFPLAHGVPGRMGRIRAYGNAIVPQLAAKFIRAFLETGP